MFLQEAHTVPGTSNLSRRDSTITRKAREHSENASTKNTERSKTIFRTCRILSEIRTTLHGYIQGANTINQKDVEFKWTAECENCFQILKRFLQESPILQYPDPEASYTLYTDASKYAYAGVLMQSMDNIDHPISRLFRGSQLNWATLTKEAYAIYMSIKKLSFYIDTAKITVKSDHLPLKKFLEKNTMNSKVNNWVVELESQNITFEYIPGIQHVK